MFCKYQVLLPFAVLVLGAVFVLSVSGNESLRHPIF